MMTELGTPQAQRLRRPSWRDSRLLIGLMLVLLATALGGWVVSRADKTSPVYAANRPLVAGQELRADDLRRVDVRLGEGTVSYLSAAGDLAPGQHVLRALDAGELIPATAVGDQDEVKTQVLSVLVDATSSSLLQVGSVVDVYVNKPSGSMTAGGKPAFAGPERVLERAAVAELPDSKGVLGGVVSQRPVHIVVPSDKVATLIEDIDLGARITLVPAPGSALKKDGS
jgi:hypothetical protein